MLDQEKLLLELILQGENSALEFKRDTITADDFAKEIVAMLNRDGGTILIGVEDDGSISGVTKTDEAWVSNIARNNVIPATDLMVKSISINDVQVLAVTVPKGQDKPYQTNRNQFLIRVGSTNRNATQQELLRLFQQSGLFHFDATSLTQTDISELNQTKLHDYFSPYGIDFVREENKVSLLKNTDIINDLGELTIVGSRIRILLFDNRIEFRSPGRLPNTVSIEKLEYGVSYATNPVLVKFLENMGYIDKLGRGLPMVVQSARQKGKTVHFEEFGEEFVVVLER